MGSAATLGMFGGSFGSYGSGGMMGANNTASAMATATATGSGIDDRSAAEGRDRCASVADMALPEFGSKEDAQLVAEFRRENFELVQGLSMEWSSCCLRFCNYEAAEAATRLKIYRDWRAKREVDMLGNAMNGDVRELLLSDCVQLPGARDRRGRPILVLLTKEIMSYSGRASSSIDDAVLACHWLLECAVHCYPESQREGLVLLVDGTGCEDDAPHKLTAMLTPVLAALQHYVPVPSATDQQATLGPKTKHHLEISLGCICWYLRFVLLHCTVCGGFYRSASRRCTA